MRKTNAKRTTHAVRCKTHTHEGSMYKPIEKPKKKRGGHNSAICHRTYLHIRFGSTFSDYKCKTK